MTPLPLRLTALPVDEITGALIEVDVATLAGRVFPHERWRVLHWSYGVTHSLSESSDSVRRVVVHSNPDVDSQFDWLRQERDLSLHQA